VPARRVLVSGAVVLAAVLSLAPPASAKTGLSVRASIDGRALAGSSSAHPIRLHATRPTLLQLRVTNDGDGPEIIQTLRLEGRVIGLTFFAHDTAVGLSVAPGTTETRRYSLDLSSLEGQATGLIPTDLKLLDRGRHELASQSTLVDVRGSWHSVYGWFGFGVAVITGILLLGALLALARHRLSPNRFTRGLQFLAPGVGLGLTLVIGLSVARVFAPRAGTWVTIVVICAAAFFLAGFLTPAPEEGEGDEFEDILAEAQPAT
jgi:hypothetical protein